MIRAMAARTMITIIPRFMCLISLKLPDFYQHNHNHPKKSIKADRTEKYPISNVELRNWTLDISLFLCFSVLFDILPYHRRITPPVSSGFLRGFFGNPRSRFECSSVNLEEHSKKPRRTSEFGVAMLRSKWLHHPKSHQSITLHILKINCKG